MEGRIIESSSLIENKRNWEDLSMDCLVKVFEKVGLQSLILDIPFVCKSWYKASLNPLCYKVLNFEFLPFNRGSWAINLTTKDLPLNKSLYPFIKIVVHRSCGIATELKFPYYHFPVYGDNISMWMEYALERCPALKTLILPVFQINRMVTESNECLIKMICKLKNLESLMTLNTKHLFKEILNQIHIHCPNFQSLTAQIHHEHIKQHRRSLISWDQIPNDIAPAIVTSLPDIKNLVLRNACLARESLLVILSGCRKLELLDVSNCRGFAADDAVILTLASRINIFKSEGSVVYEYSDDEVDLPEALWDYFRDDDDDFFGDNLEDDGSDSENLIIEDNGSNSVVYKYSDDEALPFWADNLRRL